MNINFCTLLIKQSCLKLHKLFHKSRVSFKSHYETLKLEKDCNSKDIREAFIKLSKQNHPDVNKNPKAHKEFLKIQEAYNVLSKTESRRNYDLGLAKPFHTVHNTTNVHSTGWEDHQRERKNPWDDPYFYQNRDRSRDSYYEQQSYYGIRGMERRSNGTVATFLIIMAFFSFIGQMLAINMPQKNIRPWDTEFNEKSSGKK